MKYKSIVALILLADVLAVAGLMTVLWRIYQPGLAQQAALSALQDGPAVLLHTNIITITQTNGFHWSDLESEDYSTYIRNLRAIGCPKQTIRDIIIADLDLLWSPRLRSIYPRRDTLHYWQSETEELLNDYDQREWQRLERSINRDKRAVIRDLIDVDLAAERMKVAGGQDEVERRLDFLPQDTRMDARDILERYEEESWKIREKEWEEGTALTQEERDQLKKLREDKETQLNSLLTPQQRRLFDLWMSSTASTVRHDMYGMEATEKEFLVVYKLQKAFDSQWDQSQLDWSNPTEMGRWEEDRQELEEKIASTLGDERYAQYQRGKDEEFHLLNRTVSRYGLDREKASSVYEFKAILESERQRVVLDDSLNLDQKEAALNAMNQEIKLAVREVLGKNAYNYYRRKSDWLK